MRLIEKITKIIELVDRLSKAVDSIEKRLDELENPPMKLTPVIPDQLTIYKEQTKLVGRCADGCQYPSHYYSPDGYVPCMKCGCIVQTTRITYMSDYSSIC